jgi:hypothetical protein
VYDTRTRSKERIKRPTPGNRAAYGVTWGRRFAYIGWREPSEVIEYDKDLRPTGRQCQSLAGYDFRPGEHGSAPHQALYLEGSLILAHTGRNAICAYGIADLKQHGAWSPASERRAFRGVEYHHLNTVFARPGELYAVAHMAGAQESEVWRFRRGQGLSNLQFIESYGCGRGAHNVFPLGNGLAVCDSMNSQVVRVGGEKQVVYRGPEDRLFRGVC